MDMNNDPLPLSTSLARLRRHLGTAGPSSLTALVECWEQVVGTRMARLCGIHSINHGTLVLQTGEPAVAEQLRWLSKDLRDAANAVIGSAEISEVDVRIIPGWSTGSNGPQDPLG